MEILTEQDHTEESLPTIEGPPAGLNSTGSMPSKQGFWAYLSTLLKAICSRKKQVSSQRSIKTAQDWRDEATAKNPWWGNGV